MHRLLAALAVTLFALPPVAASAAGEAWVPGPSVQGVFDLGGPRSDGSIVTAWSGGVALLNSGTGASTFAPGYKAEANAAEAYLAVSPGLHVAQAGCDFPLDETYILRLHAPIGITRVDKTGSMVTPFANVPVQGLNGITFDTTGTFGHRLLVTAPVSGKTQIAAIDCKGGVEFLTRTAPAMEGGLAVAPATFGSFGGALIAPDEVSGKTYAVAPDGTSTQVVSSGLPAGGDIGVESVAFVPAGFTRGGYLYYSDRATPGNPHPGTDHILRLSSSDLVAAGVQEGDLLAASEGGASMIGVRCDTSCRVFTVVGTPTTAHGEGHLVFATTQVASPSPPLRLPPSQPTAANNAANTAIRILAVLAVISVAAWLLLTRRRS